MEKNQSADNDETVGGNNQSNWPVIIIVVFVILPATAVFITEISTDQLIYRTVTETFSMPKPSQ